MEVLIFYGVIGIGTLILALIVYSVAVKSRKSYLCPECGEKLNTELMKAERCGVCGSKINEDGN